MDCRRRCWRGFEVGAVAPVKLVGIWLGCLLHIGILQKWKGKGKVGSVSGGVV